MVSISTILASKIEATLLGVYLLLALITTVYAYRVYGKKESTFKYAAILLGVVYMILGIVHINFILLKGADNLFIHLSVLLVLQHINLNIAYMHIASVDYRKTESILQAVVIAIITVATLLVVTGVGFSETEPEVEISTGDHIVNPISTEDTAEVEIEEVPKEKPTNQEETTNQEVDSSKPEEETKPTAYCDTSYGVYLKDCYKDEAEYYTKNFTNNEMVNKYNTDNKNLAMMETTVRDADLRLKFLTDFGKELKAVEPDNMLNAIVEELQKQNKESKAQAESKSKELKPLLTLVSKQLEKETTKYPEIPDKVEKVQEITYSTGLEEYVNSILDIGDESLMAEKMRLWVYEYLEKNEVKQ